MSDLFKAPCSSGFRVGVWASSSVTSGVYPSGFPLWAPLWADEIRVAWGWRQVSSGAGWPQPGTPAEGGKPRPNASVLGGSHWVPGSVPKDSDSPHFLICHPCFMSVLPKGGLGAENEGEGWRGQVPITVTAVTPVWLCQLFHPSVQFWKMPLMG